jgi:hypothetical protein
MGITSERQGQPNAVTRAQTAGWFHDKLALLLKAVERFGICEDHMMGWSVKFDVGYALLKLRACYDDPHDIVPRGLQCLCDMCGLAYHCLLRVRYFTLGTLFFNSESTLFSDSLFDTKDDFYDAFEEVILVGNTIRGHHHVDPHP